MAKVELSQGDSVPDKKKLLLFEKQAEIAKAVARPLRIAANGASRRLTSRPGCK
jgi:hypothetical protein